MVHPSEVSLYTLPQNDLLAQQAVENNPDSTCMVPVLALGFEDIQRRRAEQIKTNEAHAIKIQEAEEKILELKKTHHLESTVKFEQYSKKQQELTQRVIAMMKMVHVIKHKGLSIKPEEEAIKSKLDLLLTNVNKSHFKGQVDEFLAIAENNGTRKRERVEISDDGEGLRKLFQVLKETQNGLLELQDILTRCMSDVEHLENAQPFLNARK